MSQKLRLPLLWLNLDRLGNKIITTGFNSLYPVLRFPQFGNIPLFIAQVIKKRLCMIIGIINM
jgi:hypothetical protein